MPSINDILTSSQNIVVAIQVLGKTYQGIQGVSSLADISTATLVMSGAGRVCMVSITTAGSGAGAIYDANVASATTRPIYSIPNTLGVVFVNIPVGYGIVVAPGSGQVVTVSWS